MLVMLAYDVPETKHQTLLRKEFEAIGGIRVGGLVINHWALPL